jgi:hypothetical protein
VVGELAAALVAVFFQKQHKLLGIVTVTFSLLSLIASVLIVPKVIQNPGVVPVVPFFYFYLDSLSIYFVILVNLDKGQKSGDFSKVSSLCREYVDGKGGIKLLSKIFSEILNEDAKKIYQSLTRKD